MKLVEKWKASLSEGVYCAFSPSGHAVVNQSLWQEPFLQTFEIRFEDGRESVTVQNNEWVTPLVWASDSEFVYRGWGKPTDEEPVSTLQVYSLSDGESRSIMENRFTKSIVRSGISGHLSVLAEPEGQAGLFDLDVTTGAFQRLSAFDAALKQLEIYPLFGHSYCHLRQEAVIVAWKKGDYLPEGVEPTRENSQWSPILDHPIIQDDVEVRSDGAQVTQRERTQQAKRKTCYRLYLLDASGGYQEIPETHHCHNPIWSPDGALISFQRHDHFDSRNNSNSPGSVWLARREGFSLMRLGGCDFSAKTRMHPSGVFLCELLNESIPADKDCGLVRSRSRRWRGFVVRNGEVKPD